jgi:hypothetical protein
VLIDDRPIGAALNRNLGRPTVPGEAVERELDAFISKSHEQRVQTERERQALEMWQQEPERKYAERRREANRQAWTSFHEEQAERHRALLEGLIAFHEEQAAKLLNTQQEGAA